MRFKEWLIKEGGFVSKGKVSDSKFRNKPPSPGPHSAKLCGIAGGPGPGGACAVSGSAPTGPATS